MILEESVTDIVTIKSEAYMQNRVMLLRMPSRLVPFSKIMS